MHREHGNDPFQHTNPLTSSALAGQDQSQQQVIVLSFMSLPVLEENPLNEGVCFPRAGGASGMNHTDENFDISRRLVKRLGHVGDSPSEGIMRNIRHWEDKKLEAPARL